MLRLRILIDLEAQSGDTEMQLIAFRLPVFPCW